MSPLHPPERSGAWVLETSYRARAELCATLLAAAKTRLKEVEARSTRATGYKQLWEVLQEVSLLADAQIVFSAMAVESFLNFYGVRRVGEDEYGSHYERLPPHEKVSRLILACTGKRLAPKAAILTLTRRIARRRNELVHPKTKEMRPGRQLPIAKPRYLQANAALADMRRFFALYVRHDPDSLGSEHTG